jgi:preprotein translocase subunit YajC
VPQFVFILLLLAALWLLLIRPAQRRNKAQQQLLAAVDVGDEIVTAGGLYGTVTELADDEVRVEIASGVEVRIARRAIAGVVSDKSEDEPDELEPDVEPDELEEAVAETPERTKADTLSG